MRDYLQAQSDTDTQPCVLVCDIPTPLVLSAGLLPLLLPVQALAQTCLVFFVSTAGKVNLQYSCSNAICKPLLSYMCIPGAELRIAST